MTEHSWIYNQGSSDDMRIYQTTGGFHGQKMVTGTRGTGTISRTIDAHVYGGFEDGFNEIWASEWGVYQNKPSLYTEPISRSELRNALCAKNYEVGSVFSEVYCIDEDLIKDTKAYQDDSISVYEISSEIQGSARIGQRVQKNARTVPTMMMGGSYMGYAQIRSETVAGNISILNLPCP